MLRIINLEVNMKRILIITLSSIILILSGCINFDVIQIETENSTSPKSQQTTETTISQKETLPETIPTVEAETQSSTNKTRKLIALTFDDGPSPNTNRVLDVLKKHKVKGTFFVIGNRFEGYEDTLKRIVEEGHDIGGHSWSHLQLTNIKNKEIKKQIIDTNKMIQQITGHTPNIVRPPYGEFNDKVKKICKKSDLSIINWNVDTLDWKTKKKKKIAEMILKESRPGCIILSHDLYDATVKGLEIAIPKLKKQGYELVTVSELLTTYRSEMKPGAVYYNAFEVA